MRLAIEAAAAYDGLATIVLHPDRTYRTRDTFVVTGSGIRFAGGGTWLSEGEHGLYLNPTYPTADDLYAENPIEPASSGATSVTTTSPPSELAVGDWVIVYTGHTTIAGAPPVHPLGTPDSEINRVTSITGSVIGLEYPLAKDYAQEFFDVGESYATGTTSTTFAGDPAPLAVRKIVPLEDIIIDGITINHTGDGNVLQGHYIVNLQLVGGLAITTARSVMSISGWTGTIDNVTAHSTYLASQPWMFTVAYAARDVTVNNYAVTCDGVAYFHIHEGAANISFQDVTITNQDIDLGAVYTIGLRGRGYDITFDNVTVVGGSTAPGSADLRVDETFTGSATGCTFPNGVVDLSDNFTVT